MTCWGLSHPCCVDSALCQVPGDCMWRVHVALSVLVPTAEFRRRGCVCVSVSNARLCVPQRWAGPLGPSWCEPRIPSVESRLTTWGTLGQWLDGAGSSDVLTAGTFCLRRALTPLLLLGVFDHGFVVFPHRSPVCCEGQAWASLLPVWAELGHFPSPTCSSALGTERRAGQGHIWWMLRVF